MNGKIIKTIVFLFFSIFFTGYLHSETYSMNQLAVVKGDNNSYQVAISPEGGYVLVGDDQQGSVVFADHIGNVLWKYQLPNDIEMESADISSNGDVIVIGGQGRGVYVLAKSGSLLWSDESPLGECQVSITSDAEKIFVACRKMLYRFSKNGILIWSRQVDLRDASWSIWGISTSSDGSRVLLQSNSDIIIYDDQGSEISFHDIEQGNTLISSALSSDGKNFAVTVSSSVTSYVALYSVDSGELWRRASNIYPKVVFDKNNRLFILDRSDRSYVLSNNNDILYSWAEGGVNIGISDDGGRIIVGNVLEAKIFEFNFISSSNNNNQVNSLNVACYAFDGNGNDGSSNGYHAEVVGATSVTDRNNASGKALYFTGVAPPANSVDYVSYAKITDAADFHITDKLTISAWVKPDVTNVVQTIVNKWYAPDSYALSIEGGNYKFVVNLDGDQIFYVSAPATVGVWAHVVGVFDGSQIKIYKNGQLIQTKNAQGVLRDSNMPIYVANHPAWNPFKGAIDNLKIYKSALSSAEISVDSSTGCPTENNIISASAPTIVYPDNDQSLGYYGCWMFKVNPVNGITGNNYLWGFLQNGSRVWENYSDEGVLSGTEYSICPGTAGYSQFQPGATEVWVRAQLPDNSWSDAGIVNINLMKPVELLVSCPSSITYSGTDNCTAQLKFHDNSLETITATWSSSSADITVGNDGKLTAETFAGSATITANYTVDGKYFSGEATVSAVSATIYNVYLAVFVPTMNSFFVNSVGNWSAWIGGYMPVFATEASAWSKDSDGLDILNAVANLAPSETVGYIGYGINTEEMLANRRYKILGINRCLCISSPCINFSCSFVN